MYNGSNFHLSFQLTLLSPGFQLSLYLLFYPGGPASSPPINIHFLPKLTSSLLVQFYCLFPWSRSILGFLSFIYNIYKQIYDTISNLNIGQDIKQTILGSYVKFEADGPIAYLYNPPKQTELVSLQLHKLKHTDKLPKGFILDKENTKDDSKIFKVSKDIDQKELSDFLTRNFS